MILGKRDEIFSRDCHYSNLGAECSVLISKSYSEVLLSLFSGWRIFAANSQKFRSNYDESLSD